MRANAVVCILALLFLIWGADATIVSVFTDNKVGFGDRPYVDWRDNLSYNYDAMEELQLTLNEDHYSREYEDGVFDCVTMSIICEKWLEQRHYDSYILLSNNMHHAWVVVRFKDGSMVPVETTADPGYTMGQINWNPKYLEGFMYDTATMLEIATE